MNLLLFILPFTLFIQNVYASAFSSEIGPEKKLSSKKPLWPSKEIRSLAHEGDPTAQFLYAETLLKKGVQKSIHLIPQESQNTLPIVITLLSRKELKTEKIQEIRLYATLGLENIFSILSMKDSQKSPSYIKFLSSLTELSGICGLTPYRLFKGKKNLSNVEFKELYLFWHQTLPSKTSSHGFLHQEESLRSQYPTAPSWLTVLYKLHDEHTFKLALFINTLLLVLDTLPLSQFEVIPHWRQQPRYNSPPQG